MRSWVLICISLCCLLVSTGCEDTNFQLATEAGMDAVRAVTLSDREVRMLAARASAASDQRHQVAETGSPYGRRLLELTREWQRFEGQTYDIKAYISPKINAFAMADGTIRVYTGLMDLMDDRELLFVIGHEMGHVAKKHSRKKLMVAYAARALRKGVSSQENILGLIAASALGGFVEALANAQYSQKEEAQADTHGLYFLEQTGLPRPRAVDAAAAALEKLASPDVDHTILSSHPEPAKRAARIRALATGGKEASNEAREVKDRMFRLLTAAKERMLEMLGVALDRGGSQ